MSGFADNDEERLDRVLCGLPLRPAPATLESRVFGELARRAALPWWRRSFAQWPLPARALFVPMCVVLIAVALMGGADAAAGMHNLTWLREAGGLLLLAGNVVALLSQVTPPAWLYGAIAVCAVLYAVLFALGAIVYRTLYLSPMADETHS